MQTLEKILNLTFKTMHIHQNRLSLQIFCKYFEFKIICVFSRTITNLEESIASGHIIFNCYWNCITLCQFQKNKSFPKLKYVKMLNFLVTLQLIDINDLCCLHSIMMISAKNRQARGRELHLCFFFVKWFFRTIVHSFRYV